MIAALKTVCRAGDWGYLVLPTAILIASALLEIWLGNNYFSRSGALIVLVAVVFESRAVIYLYNCFLALWETNEERISASNSAINFLMNAQAQRGSGKSIDITDDPHWKRKSDHEANRESRLSDASEAYEKLFAYSKIALLIGVVGTIIWGYGDIISCALRCTELIGCFKT